MSKGPHADSANSAAKKPSGFNGSVYLKFRDRTELLHSTGRLPFFSGLRNSVVPENGTRHRPTPNCQCKWGYGVVIRVRILEMT